MSNSFLFFSHCFSSSFFVCLLLFSCPPLQSHAETTKPTSLFLPLKTQQLPSVYLPRPAASSPPTNKLYFHHNVSLTVTLSVGTPPQNVSMVLDTGSELSWLLCSTNTTTNAAAAKTAAITSSSFNPRLSSTYAKLPCTSPTCTVKTRDLPNPATCDAGTNLCHVSLSYADASTSEGDLSTETFHIGQSDPLRGAVFGCMTSTYSSTPPQGPAASGLLGMNRGALSLVSQLGTRRFSYCISDRSPGVLLLGQTVLPFTLLLNYTALIQISLPLPYFDRVAYSVQLEGIRVSSTLLPIPKSVLVPDHTGAGQTMVDSGTQFTFLLGPAYAVLKTEFLRQTKGLIQLLDEPNFVFQGAFDLCYRVAPGREAAAMGALPAVTLVFRGAEVTVSGERLLYRVEGERRGGDCIWCFTFGNSDLVPMEAYVIGHHHQQNVWVEYDLENGRVGFAPMQCDLASQRLSQMT